MGYCWGSLASARLEFILINALDTLEVTEIGIKQYIRMKFEPP